MHSGSNHNVGVIYDKQEMLAKELVSLIDRKMKERAPAKSSLDYIDSKVLKGLSLTNNTKNDRVPSIPCNYNLT